MIVVYDKNGNKGFHHHAIDAKEAIATGNWFKVDPRLPEPPPPPPKVITQGEDISPAKAVSMKGFEVEDKASEPPVFESKPKEEKHPKHEPKEEAHDTSRRRRS